MYRRLRDAMTHQYCKGYMACCRKFDDRGLGLGVLILAAASFLLGVACAVGAMAAAGAWNGGRP